MSAICTACHSLECLSRGDSPSLARPLPPSLAALLGIFLVSLWSKAALATITQGDFSIFGGLTSAAAGRWGEGSEPGGTPSLTDGVPAPNTTVTVPGKGSSSTGGSFDFNHWDLVSARQSLGLSTDDHIIKSYKLLNRLDTLFVQDARVFADYLAFYDAFPDLKHKGRAEAGRDWGNFTAADRINEFTRNELKEYYAELNFTDNFAMRVGKQQVIWSEADAFSGTEVTNPGDFRFGNVAGNSRINLRMLKFDYILPDFLKTANNEFEFFWIPGDFQGALKAQISDARNPWIPPVPLNLTLYNQAGQPFREGTLMDQGAKPMFLLPSNPALQTLSSIAGTKSFFSDLHVIFSQNQMNNSIDNSEFGARYSTLLSIGNGLQASLIYLYEARSNKIGLCANCTQPAPFVKFFPGIWLAVSPQPYGIQNFGTSAYDLGRPSIKNNLGTIRLLIQNEYVRQSFFGLTGTYYDKDLTDMVYRYDIFYAPKVVAGGSGGGFGFVAGGSLFGAPPKWGETSKWIIAADRPTYIPWISKQHTFLVAQYTVTWNPDSPSGARALSSFVFLAANNWLMDGRLTTLNFWAWDPDDNVGLVSSGNSYRYSSNILFGLNGTWFLGRSGLSAGGVGGILSRAQRTNELALSFTYEL